MKSKSIPFYGYRIAMVLLSLCFYPNLLQAKSQEEDSKIIYQNKITITGVVSDESGVLPGVIVQDKASSNSTLTDADGNYSIQIKPGDILEFSYIGYISKKIIITNQKTLNITLDQDTQQLDEIVVNAGYYTVKDRERTGSIARVTAKDIEHQPVLNPLQAIQGRMAGVDITQNSGVPGSGFNIEIRGRNSLRKYQNNSLNGNAPLYIIDGLAIPNTNLLNSTLSNSILPLSDTNILNTLNPNDIESIEILKDADATAIYGSRGANGVVLITTKKNKSNDLKISLSSASSFSTVANKMKLLNTYQFNQIREEAFKNDNITTFPNSALDLNGEWDKDSYTDWQKLLIGNTARSQNYQLSIRGGNNNTTFFTSYNNDNQTTVFPTDNGYKRHTFLLNLIHNSLDNKFSLNTITNYSIQSNNLIANDLTKTALTMPPNAPSLYNQNGALNWNFPANNNPIANMFETYRNNSSMLLLKADFSFKVNKNLTLKMITGYTSTNTEENRITPHTIYNPDLNYTSAQSKSQNTVRTNKNYILEPQILFSPQISKSLNINALVGFTYQNNETDALHLLGEGFQSNDFIWNIAASKNKTISQSANLQYKYTAIFSRINLDYNSKYLLNITGRRDGSSRFGSNQKFGNFGAIGMAWIISNENFLKDNSFLNFAKLRSSWGTSGSDNIGDYQYLDSYSVKTATYDDIPGLAPSRLHNPTFSWEKTTKSEVALELEFINRNMFLELAWYRNISTNQLVGVPLPGTTGFLSMQDNLPAKVENKGWEINISSKVINTKNFKWTTAFNISFPKNTLISFPDLESSTYANTYIVGKSTNLVKRFYFEGIDKVNGNYSFTDYNNDSKITSPIDAQSLHEIEKKYYGGFSNSINYKKFHFDFLLQFVKQVNYNYNAYIPLLGSLNNMPVEVLSYWNDTSENYNYGKPTSGTNSSLLTSFSSFISSSATISDASYIRLKNISISYQTQLSKKDVKLYIQGQNLLTITNYFGLDPEFTAIGYLPPLKTFSFGIQITF
ncbi:SusC/RagA family TonB-linked outer membrane protein [Myroides sp. LJL119]